MARFRYVAMNSKGEETEGVVDANRQTQAISMIRQKGFFPTRVTSLDSQPISKVSAVPKAIGGKKAKTSKKGLSMEIKIPGMAGKVKQKQLMVLTRQLATLVDAGLPLLRQPWS